MTSTDLDWFADLQALWRRPLEFWPTADQDPAERRNSLARLVLYTSILIAASTRSGAWLVRGLLCLGVLGVAASVVVQPAPACMRPTATDPFMNPYRWTDAKMPACEYDIDGKLAAEVVAARARGFPPGSDPSPYRTVPGATSLNPRAGFVKFAYGGEYRPTCKQDRWACGR